MTNDIGVGAKIVRLLEVHPRTSGLSNKARAALLKIDPSLLTRWSQGTEPRLDKLNRAVDLLGLSVSDFVRPIEELEHVVRSIGASAWETAEWTVSSRFVERWRHRWASAFELIRGSHLMFLRIPRKEGDDLISSSLLTVTEVDHLKGIRFSVVNIDDSQGEDSAHIRYDYDGLAFPVSDTLYFLGGRLDGSEPFSMVIDLPDTRGALSGYIVAVGRAPGRHYPMARRVAIVPRSWDILSVKEIRSELGIFALADAPRTARVHTEEQD